MPRPSRTKPLFKMMQLFRLNLLPSVYPLHMLIKPSFLRSLPTMSYAPTTGVPEGESGDFSGYTGKEDMPCPSPLPGIEARDSQDPEDQYIPGACYPIHGDPSVTRLAPGIEQRIGFGVIIMPPPVIPVTPMSPGGADTRKNDNNKPAAAAASFPEDPVLLY